MSAIYAQVEANPEKSVGTIYNEERAKIIEIHKLNDIEKDKLFALLPSQRNVQANLNLYKKEFVPHEPTSTADFDPYTDWFNLPNDECITKADLTLALGKRITFFSTDYLLKVFARAAAISCDGTFKMSPKHWKQLFIVCAEISWLNIWIPCAFAFLPDKKQETYKAFFNLLKQNLDRIGEKVSAEYLMCDFELGIRNSVKDIFPDVTLKGPYNVQVNCGVTFVTRYYHQKCDICGKGLVGSHYLFAVFDRAPFVKNR